MPTLFEHGRPAPSLLDGCPDCRDQSFAFDGAFRMAPYEGLLRDAIVRMKQWTGEDLAEVIGGVWAKQMAPRLVALSPDVVIPVPLHWTRRWRRGFNSCDILASCLRKNWPFRAGHRLCGAPGRRRSKPTSRVRPPGAKMSSRPSRRGRALTYPTKPCCWSMMC